MTRPPTLTDKQIRAVREHIDMFPAEILKLPEFAGTEVTRHTIRNYQNRLKNATIPDDEEDLLARLRQYLSRHGLPSRFHSHSGVTGFVTYLENQIHLRAIEGED
jgi:hypothetical protein